MYKNREFNVFVSDLVCIIVIYKLSLEESDSFISLSKSLCYTDNRCTIVVYDNSPTQQYINKHYPNWDIIYIHNPDNEGVSKAYNEGAKLAKMINKKWLLLLDQDTFFEIDIFRKFFESIYKYEKGKIFIPILQSGLINISPSYYFLKRGSGMSNLIPGPLLSKNKSFLNSGLLILLETFLEVEGYEETIRLYFSDFSFSEKLHQLNKYFYIIDSFAKHSLNSNDGTNINTFTLYCEGAYQFAIKSNILDRFWLIITASLRSVKLSIKYKKVIYLKICINQFILKLCINNNRER